MSRISIWREGIKIAESDPSRWCSATGKEATCTNWNTRESLWTSGSTFFLLWGRLSPGTGCLERLWSLEDTQKPSGFSPRQLGLGGSAWARVMSQMASSSPIQPQPLPDSFKALLFQQTPSHNPVFCCWFRPAFLIRKYPSGTLSVLVLHPAVSPVSTRASRHSKKMSK